LDGVTDDEIFGSGYGTHHWSGFAAWQGLEIEVVDRVFDATDLVRLCLPGVDFGCWESKGEPGKWEKESQHHEHVR
jgi:hypothetical protein